MGTPNFGVTVRRMEIEDKEAQTDEWEEPQVCVN